MSFIQVTKPGDLDYPLDISRAASPGSIEEIRRRCNKGSPYVDPDFPANDTSIGGFCAGPATGKESYAEGEGVRYVWLRAHEICEKNGFDKPNFAVVNEDGAGGSDVRCSSLDLHQGRLGDCWYLAALATVCTQPDALEFVVPVDNYGGYEDGNYCGAFHFRFYNFYIAKFVDVIVDDLIPCNESTLKPAFGAALFDKDGNKSNEFWVTLLEKAFAKFLGNYTKLNGGRIYWALGLMTGGCVGTWFFHEAREPGKYDEYAARVRRYLDSTSKYFLALGTHSNDDERRKEANRLGIVGMHGYGIVGGAEVKDKRTGEGRLLLQIQNPHGHGEWSGTFSDGDDDGWADMERDLRTRDTNTGSAQIDQGTFWMDFHDVLKFFELLDYCVVGVGDGSKYCTIRAIWPASLQETKIPDSPTEDQLTLCPAFIFEVKRELLSTLIPEEHAGKCVCSFRITIGEDGVKMDPLLDYIWLIYEIQEGDDEASLMTGDVTALEKFYKQRDSLESSVIPFAEEGEGSACESELYLKPGRYVLVLPPMTEGEVAELYVGKPIPFTLTLFTENETDLVLVNEAFRQKPEDFVIVTYQFGSNL